MTSADPRPFRSIHQAPRDGRVIEVESLDYGRGPATTVYRARYCFGAWRNAECPGEELHHLQGWREADHGAGLDALFDGMPIAVLERIVARKITDPERERETVYAGQFIESLAAIGEIRRRGDEVQFKAAVEALSGLVTTAHRLPPVGASA